MISYQAKSTTIESMIIKVSSANSAQINYRISQSGVSYPTHNYETTSLGAVLEENYQTEATMIVPDYRGK